ncbi:MAG TPA: DUF481 domain-containing protein [Candidatus Polarisedimenticolaceae bacterium]|nr:DUF481 domain-containing protein [Candidatus Polarisedimenticolaceae bacterium]
MTRSWGRLVRVWLAVALAATGLVLAQQDEQAATEEKRWSNKTELGLTSTSGNADATNLSLGNNYKRNWAHAELLFDIAAIRNESEILSYELNDPLLPPDAPGNAFLVETTETTAETYAAGLTYRHDITKRLFWYVNGTWYRNQPAGIDDRYRGGAGLGYRFIETARHQLLGEVGGTHTDETQTDDETQTYTSARGVVQYDYKISDTAELASDLEGFFDVDDSDNWQSNWITSLTASLNSQLALKVTYAIVYNNRPPNRSIAPGRGTPAGAPSLEFPADNTDRFLTASVVLNF